MVEPCNIQGIQPAARLRQGAPAQGSHQHGLCAQLAHSAHKDRLTDPAHRPVLLWPASALNAQSDQFCKITQHPGAADAPPASAELFRGVGPMSSAHRPVLLRPRLPVRPMASLSFNPCSPPKGMAIAACRQGKDAPERQPMPEGKRGKVALGGLLQHQTSCQKRSGRPPPLLLQSI